MDFDAILDKGFYEIHHIPETSFHPHPALHHFKIIMVSMTTMDGAVVCKWPSIKSLSFFFKNRLQVLPTFDEECTLTQCDAVRLLKRRIDSEQLCLYYGWSPDAWLHDQAMEHLNAAMDMITVEHMDMAQRNSFRPDEFYAIDYDALPQLRDDVIGYVRVAWVVEVHDHPSVAYPTVQVCIPSMASLKEFMSKSESLIIPCFDQYFTISLASARSCLMRKLPVDLVFRLCKRRDIWINEFMEKQKSYRVRSTMMTR